MARSISWSSLRNFWTKLEQSSLWQCNPQLSTGNGRRRTHDPYSRCYGHSKGTFLLYLRLVMPLDWSFLVWTILAFLSLDTILLWLRDAYWFPTTCYIVKSPNRISYVLCGHESGKKGKSTATINLNTSMLVKDEIMNSTMHWFYTSANCSQFVSRKYLINILKLALSVYSSTMRTPWSSSRARTHISHTPFVCSGTKKEAKKKTYCSLRTTQIEVQFDKESSWTAVTSLISVSCWSQRVTTTFGTDIEKGNEKESIRGPHLQSFGT